MFQKFDIHSDGFPIETAWNQTHSELDPSFFQKLNQNRTNVKKILFHTSQIWRLLTWRTGGW